MAAVPIGVSHSPSGPPLDQDRRSIALCDRRAKPTSG
jgi:hypothetical protein